MTKRNFVRAKWFDYLVRFISGERGCEAEEFCWQAGKLMRSRSVEEDHRKLCCVLLTVRGKRETQNLKLFRGSSAV